MAEIKSKKADEYLKHNAWKERPTCPLENVRLYAAQEAVDIAETEAEQRHAQEIATLKEKAVTTHCHYCEWSEPNCPRKDCGSLLKFTQKLNEQ